MVLRPNYIEVKFKDAEGIASLKPFLMENNFTLVNHAEEISFNDLLTPLTKRGMIILS